MRGEREKEEGQTERSLYRAARLPSHAIWTPFGNDDKRAEGVANSVKLHSEDVR